MTSVRAAFLISLAALAPLACDLGGGLNQNQQNPGNQEDGTALGKGDIAIDPSGTYFLSRAGDRLMYAEIAGTEAKILKAIENPERVLFGVPGVMFVTEDYEKGDWLVGYDVAREEVLWRHDIEIQSGDTTNQGVLSFPKINISHDGSMVVVTSPRQVEVLSAADGRLIRSESFSRIVVDVDILPEDDRVVVTLDHDWDGDTPDTRLSVVPMGAAGEARSIRVPNCSDELAVEPNGRYAFLAPTSCDKDPVSVIDLDAGRFERNLPGFGPVAIAPDGKTMVAFLDAENIDRDLFDDEGDIPPADGDRYHLMLIDSGTLEFDTVAVGDTIPRYAMTRDGKIVLVDSPSWFDDGAIRVLDVDTRTLEPVSGPDVRLDHWVLSQDSTRLFLIDAGLYELNIPERIVASIALRFLPTNMNLTQDDAYLLLREDPGTVWVYDTIGERLVRAVGSAGKPVPGKDAP